MRVRASPAATAFATGEAVMAVELLVPRLVARHLGASVVGTFATGFLLVPGMGTSVALAAVAAGVALLGAVRALEPCLRPAGTRALSPPAAVPAPSRAPPLSPALCGALAALTGAALLALEVVAGRRAA